MIRARKLTWLIVFASSKSATCAPSTSTQERRVMYLHIEIHCCTSSIDFRADKLSFHRPYVYHFLCSLSLYNPCSYHIKVPPRFAGIKTFTFWKLLRTAQDDQSQHYCFLFCCIGYCRFTGGHWTCRLVHARKPSFWPCISISLALLYTWSRLSPD